MTRYVDIFGQIFRAVINPAGPVDLYWMKIDITLRATILTNARYSNFRAEQWAGINLVSL